MLPRLHIPSLLCLVIFVSNLSAQNKFAPPFVKNPTIKDLKISHRKDGDGGLLYILDYKSLGRLFVFSWQDTNGIWKPKLNNQFRIRFRGPDFGPFQRTYDFDTKDKRISAITFHSKDKYPRLIQIFIIKRNSPKIFDLANNIAPDLDYLSHFPVIDFDAYNYTSTP